MSHQHPYDTHPEMVINRAKFDVCMSSSWGGVKAHLRTYTRRDRIVLYSVDKHTLSSCQVTGFLANFSPR